MSTVLGNFTQSQLAFASYAVLSAGTPSVAALKDERAGMSDSQANRFSEDWRVIDQYTDAASGLSATIFQKTTGGPLSLAIRGTEPNAGDLTADGLLALGLPASLNPQFTALKNHLDTVWLAAGGALRGKTFSVAGHSLGGYLAAAVKEQYGSQVSDAYLYNAPGVAGLVGNILSLFGLSGTPTGNVWNIAASEGASIISGLGAPIGTPVSIQIEAASSPGFGNHSILRLTDALALQSLYATLDPALSTAQLNALVDASGNPMNQTLEAALDSLRKLLLNASDATPADDRDAFYTHLYALSGNSIYADLADHAQITVLSSHTVADLQALAASDTAQGLATRYALQALNPFALTGADYTSLNSDGALDLYAAAAHPNGMTEAYLADRSNFLQYQLRANTEEKTVLTGITESGLPNTDQLLFVDKASGRTLAVMSDFNSDGSTPTGKQNRFISFGTSDGDSLAGDVLDDRLYGMGGSDTLNGENGADYLEGNAGDDTLTGGDGNDTLLDSDGSGHIDWAGVTLKGDQGLSPGQWKKLGDQSWLDQTHNLYYTLTAQPEGGNTLSIVRDGERLQIRNWVSGNLGITLGAGSETTAPATTKTLVGDLAPIDFDPAAGGIQTHKDALGNIVTDPGTPETDREDILYDSTGNDLIQAGGGNDVIWLDRGGNNLIEGNGGADNLQAANCSTWEIAA